MCLPFCVLLACTLVLSALGFVVWGGLGTAWDWWL